jgi:hypothetical protein
MSFIRYLFGETKPSKISLVFILSVTACFLLPSKYEKEMPAGFELGYYILILTISAIAGSIFALIENKKPLLTQASPVFDQASSVVISLVIILLPIYLLRPGLFSMALLVFVVELGLVIGKYIYVQFNTRSQYK